MAGVALGCLTIYELYTDSFKLARLQKAADILVTISSLGGPEHSEISDAASNILADLDQLIIESSRQEESNTKAMIQAGFAAAPWVIILVFFTISEMRDKSNDWAEGFGGILVLIFFATLIGYGVDVTESNWYRFGIPQIANLIMMILLYLLGRKDEDEEHNKRLQDDAAKPRT